MLNIVVIGTGSISLSRHIPSILNSKQANLYGIYNRTVDKAKKIALTYGCKFYESLDSIWTDDAIDAVIICTPPDSHCELTIAALQNKKHVLVEKPMASNAQEAAIMVETAKETGYKLMVSHNQRLYRPHLKAKELIANGEIGEIISYRSALGFPRKISAGSEPDWKNVIGEVGSHRIDLMRYILGEKITDVFGHLYNTFDPHSTVDDNAIVILKHANNIIGTIITSRTSFGSSDRMTQIFGTKGSITLYSECSDILIEKGTEEKTVISFADLLPQNKIEITDIVERFFTSIIEDSELLVPPEDGYEVMLALDAIRLSNTIKTWVSL